METYGVREMFLRRTHVFYHGAAEKSATTCQGLFIFGKVSPLPLGEG